MTIEVEIAIEGAGWQGRPALEALVTTAVRAALAQSGARLATAGEVSVLLCDDAFIATLNQRWRGKSQPTNVLSFPSGHNDCALGDIAVAYETAAREAAAEGKTLDDHLTHLLVHGCLHLVGFDHEATDDAERMEALERRVLATLGVADPYAGELVAQAGS